MIKNRTYIILLSCLAVFGIVMFLVFGVGNIKNGTYSSTIIVGDSTIWSYNNKKWKNISYKSSIEKLNWDTYKVYSNNKLVGNYLMYYSDKWYVEDFYLVSNAFPLDFDPEYIFSIAFMVKDKKIYYLYNDISKNTSFNGCKPYYNSFMDVNNDGVYEIILSCGKYSASEQVDMLYNYTDKGFKIIISNQ